MRWLDNLIFLFFKIFMFQTYNQLSKNGSFNSLTSLTNDFSQIFQTKNSFALALNYIIIHILRLIWCWWSVKFKLLCMNNFCVITDLILSSSKKSIGEINIELFLYVKYASFFYKITEKFKFKKAKWKFLLNKFLTSLIRWPECSVTSGSFKNIRLSTSTKVGVSLHEFFIFLQATCFLLLVLALIYIVEISITDITYYVFFLVILLFILILLYNKSTSPMLLLLSKTYLLFSFV